MATIGVLPEIWTPILGLVLFCGCGNGSESDWPPTLDSIFDPEAQACLVPECDESGSAGFEPSVGWWRSLTTTSTNCPEIVANFNPKAQVGNVEEDGPLAIDEFTGTCYYEDGERIGTIKKGAIARCRRSVDSWEVITFETTIVEFDGEQGAGTARVYVRNIPGNPEGCDIDLDVTYQLKH